MGGGVGDVYFNAPALRPGAEDESRGAEERMLFVSAR